MIPWSDIRSLAGINNIDINNLKIKNIVIIPEIQVTNPPLHKASIRIPTFDYEIGNKKFLQNQGIEKILTIPKKFQEEIWTVSDVFASILQVGEFASSFTPFSYLGKWVKSSQIVDNLNKAKDAFGVISTAKSFIANNKNNYLHSTNNLNSIVLNIDKKINQNEDIKLKINELILEGKLNSRDIFGKSEVKFTKVVLRIDFE